MRKIFLLCLFTILGWTLQAQDQKLRVAVFDPTSSGTAIDEGTKIAVRELVSSTFVNTGKYTIVERSLLDKVMKEAAFSNSDNVDESQATELGRLAGANKVVLSVVTLVGGRNMLSIKVIDVKTAAIDQQKTKIVNTNDLLDIVEPLTLELLGEKMATPTTKASGATSKPVAQPIKKPVQAPAVNPLVRSVNNFIFQNLAGQFNRYSTDEERFKHLKSKGDLKKLVTISAKPVYNIPQENDSIISFCYISSNKGGDKPLFLFFNGALIGVGTLNKGFYTVIADDVSSGVISLWNLSDNIFTTSVNFSVKHKYIFNIEGNGLVLK